MTSIHTFGLFASIPTHLARCCCGLWLGFLQNLSRGISHQGREGRVCCWGHKDEEKCKVFPAKRLHEHSKPWDFFGKLVKQHERTWKNPYQRSSKTFSKSTLIAWTRIMEEKLIIFLRSSLAARSVSSVISLEMSWDVLDTAELTVRTRHPLRSWTIFLIGTWPSKLRLVGIYEICGTAYAFAALKHDGTVLTWGHPVAWQQATMERQNMHIPASGLLHCKIRVTRQVL